MVVLSNLEYEFCKKFSDGAIVVSDIEKNIVNRFQSTGLVRTGFTGKDENYLEICKLTSLGFEIYKRDRVLRNSIKRFFYYLRNT